MDAPQSIDLIDEAATHLRWARRRLAALRDLPLPPDLMDHEKLFHSLLRHLQLARNALLDASTLVDGGTLRQQIAMDQDHDPLLHYFCMAGDNPGHTLLGTTLDLPDLGFQVIDTARYREARERYGFTDDFRAMLSIAFGTGAGFHRLQRKLRDGHEPDRIAIKLAGLKLIRSWRSVGLKNIEYEARIGMPMRTAAPKSHFGVALPNSADAAAEKVIHYYESMLRKLPAGQPQAY
ncbi:MAG: hypothetical protein OQK79_06580 [Rhodanobacter sp.]|jgi:hypothetical protein|nr:hypothetical protein [Rhodanobacter sp.]